MNILVPKHYAREIEANLSAGIKGEYQIQVIDTDGSIRYPLGEQFHKNVITNIGLLRLLTNASWAGNPGYDATITDAIFWCRVGSGTNAAAAGDTQLQTQLANPAPTNTNFTGSGGCETDVTDATSAGTVTHKWTKQFAAVTGSVAINEIGLGWDDVDANTLFSRFKTPATINLTDGQILRVVYQLTISCPSYFSSVSVDGLSSNGFDLTGDLRMIGAVDMVFGQLTASGLLNTASAGGQIFQAVAQGTASIAPRAGLYTSSAFPAVGSTLASGTELTNMGTRVSRSTPTTGALYVDGVYEFGVAAPPDTVTTARTFSIYGWSGTGVTPQPQAGLDWTRMMLLMDANQTKSNEHRLQIGIRSGWTRL